MKLQLFNVLISILLLGAMRAQTCEKSETYAPNSSGCSSQVGCVACTSCTGGGISKGKFRLEDISLSETGCYSIFIIIGPVIGFLIIVIIVVICCCRRRNAAQTQIIGAQPMQMGAPQQPGVYGQQMRM